MFKGAKLDGPTLHAVFYFTLKEETAKALQDLESAEPSVRLLAGYFRFVVVPFFFSFFFCPGANILRRALAVFYNVKGSTIHGRRNCIPFEARLHRRLGRLVVAPSGNSSVGWTKYSQQRHVLYSAFSLGLS